MLTAKLMVVLIILEKKARPKVGLNAKPGMCSLHIRTYMATWETATAAETQMAGLECGAILQTQQWNGKSVGLGNVGSVTKNQQQQQQPEQQQRQQL